MGPIFHYWGPYKITVRQNLVKNVFSNSEFRVFHESGLFTAKKGILWEKYGDSRVKIGPLLGA